MAIIKRLKNNSGASKFVVSRNIGDQEYYLVPVNRWNEVLADDDLLDDVDSGDLIVNDGTTDLSSVEGLNWLNKFEVNSNIEVDSEGRQISRLAAGKKGWVYTAHFFEMETSKNGSLFCEDYAGVTCPSLSIKFYNASNVEITDAGVYADKQAHLDALCVKTEVLFKPDFDYELISGTIRLDTTSSEDCRLWVVGGVLELGALGTKEFAKGMNLKYLGADEVIETDGRASKYMSKTITGLPYQGNQLKFIIKHVAGYNFKIMPALEYFRA